jgi:hypothetical protein
MRNIYIQLQLPSIVLKSACDATIMKSLARLLTWIVLFFVIASRILPCLVPGLNSSSQLISHPAPSMLLATHAAFPQPGHQRAACFANVYRQLSVVQSRYLSRMLTAAAGLHTARTGSGWIRGAPQATPEIPH